MAIIITPTSTQDIVDGAVTEIKLSNDINISKFVNDAGYITGLGSFTTDNVTEGTLNLYYTDTRVVNVVTTDDFDINGIWNFTKIVVNPNDYPKPEWAQYPGFTGDNAAIFQYTDSLQRMSSRRVTSGDGVTFNEVYGTMYDYDVSSLSEGVGGPGFFNVIGDQTNGYRFLTAIYNKANGLTTSGNEFDTYYGNYTLVAYEKESGVNEVSRNIMTFDRNGAQFHNSMRVVNMPTDSGTQFLSHAALVYTGSQDEVTSAEIELYNATDDAYWSPVIYEQGVTTNAQYNRFQWTIRLASIDTATLNGLGTQEAGSMAYCTDGDAGSACLAVYDGTDWRRVSFGAAISTT